MLNGWLQLFLIVCPLLRRLLAFQRWCASAGKMDFCIFKTIYGLVGFIAWHLQPVCWAICEIESFQMLDMLTLPTLQQIRWNVQTIFLVALARLSKEKFHCYLQFASSKAYSAHCDSRIRLLENRWRWSSRRCSVERLIIFLVNELGFV